MDNKPKALDICCCAGGASRGLALAGFDVTGLDIRPQPRYPYPFILGDALTADIDGYDLYFTSPPCQFGSIVTPKSHRANHQNLIPAIRERLQAAGKPYIIENVENNRRHLINPIKLCGSMFGLQTFRHRYFEVYPFISLLTPPCRHDFKPLLVTTAGANSRAIREKGNYKSVKNAPLAYGIDWMIADELKEAIPPAFTEFLGSQIMQACFEKAA